jgi:hypothetical protein
MADTEPVAAKALTHSAHRQKRVDKDQQCEQNIMATSRLELPLLTAHLVGIYI